MVASGEEEESLSDALVKIAEKLEVARSPDDELFVRFNVNGHHEVDPIGSTAFKLWLGREFKRERGKVPRATAVEAAIAATEARAWFDSEPKEIFIRSARVGAGIYIDLGDAEWHAIEVSADGCRIIPESPVWFRRGPGMLPLPVPVKGGSFGDLEKFLNTDKDGFTLTVGFILGALGGRKPFPILDLTSEHGTGKSGFATMIRALIDPSGVAQRAQPRKDDDLLVAARNSYILGFDNISRIPDWLSDAVCRLTSGSGAGTRKFYTNTEEVLFRDARPVIMNGIEGFIERPDLADRTIGIQLDLIPEGGESGERN